MNAKHQVNRPHKTETYSRKLNPFHGRITHETARFGLAKLMET